MLLTPEDARTRVLAGAAYLDAHGPASWRHLINTASLNMNSTSLCVIAQLYGDFQLAAEDDPDLATTDLGFWVPNPALSVAIGDAEWQAACVDHQVAYDVLTSAWIDYLQASTTD